MMSKGNDQADRMMAQLDQQDQQTKAEVENKRQALARQSLNIVKSFDAQEWINPDAPTNTETENQ